MSMTEMQRYTFKKHILAVYVLTKKWVILCIICTYERQKCFQLQGVHPLTRGSAPGAHWGLYSQTPTISSFSVLAMSPHFYDEVFAYG